MNDDIRDSLAGGSSEQQRNDHYRMVGHESLIERLEAASKGSREMDAEIDCVVRDRMTHKLLPPGFTMTRGDDAIENTSIARAPYIHRDRGPAPNFTTSIDAAITLVPEGWDYCVRGGYSGVGVVWVQFMASPGRDFISVEAATPALALCIAALKAISGTPADHR